ncbi:unnamed protein product [Psylliodes chrysocephalus]|uniref:NADP-dependent oxidoreductase domain-containing protein n=1 Tax=Psylliodes chrysocephalus TaxID=3402493 RepID=A0A9P0GG91_9CUCU|nr:unnamed protein product [Psylliodes chrysocephala]
MKFSWFTFLGHLLFVLMNFQAVVCSDQEATELAKDMNFKLHSGDLMPLIGFGTYQIHGDELIKDVLDLALAAGYRLIDSATVYGNEVSIGLALKELLPKYNLTRKDIFITSKLAPTDQGTKAYVALERSLRNLDCDYLDLYLIHWPGVQGIRSEERNNSLLRGESWQQLARAAKDGLTRNIGVSNYNNIAVIPKARSKKHIDDNIDLDFIIPDEDMKTLNTFQQVKYAWDPDVIA